MNHTPSNPGGQSGMTRRKFFGTAAAATAAGVLLPTSKSLALGGIVDIGGVKVGAISYSYRALPGSAEEILEYLTSAGMDTVELMGGPAEAYAGAPEAPPFPRGRFNEMSDEERNKLRAEREAHNEKVDEWRKSAPLNKFEELGAMYRNAGVEIDILKLGDPRWSDDMIDYAFKAAKAVGARGISFEISNEGAERIAPFATKHQMYVGMHNHTQVAEEGFSFDVPLSFSKYNMLNLDIGHYVAGLGKSPIPIIQKYHERITHLHLKDRRTPDNGGDNVAWGEGDTPIAEVLRLLQKEQYPITAMIEMEYEVPEGSTVLIEVDKCIAYCKGALA